MTEEGSLKSAVEDYLQVLENQGKLKFFRLNAGDFIEVRGDSRRRIKGCKKGTADFEVIEEIDDHIYRHSYPRVIFIETKSKTGKQTKEQKEFERDVIFQGCEYHIVRTFEEIVGVLRR